MIKDFKKNLQIVKYVFKICPFYIIFSILYIIISSINAISKVYVIRIVIELVEKIVKNETDFSSVIKILTIYLSIIVIATIMQTIYNGYISPVYRTIYVNKMQKIMFERVKKVDYSDFDNPTFYDQYNRALRDGVWRGIRVYEDLMNFISSIIKTLTIGTFIIVNDVLLIVIVLISTIINIIVMNISSKINYDYDKKTEPYRRMYYYVNRTFYQQRFAAELKTTPISDLLIERYKEACYKTNREFIKSKKKILKLDFLKLLTSYMLESAGSYLYLGYRLFTKVITIAEFASTLNAANQFSSYFVETANFFNKIKINALYIDDFLWYMNYVPSLETIGSIPLKEELLRLDIDNITFKYPDTEKLIIPRLKLEINKGEKLAIVGLNGAGKTTLIKLLLKFYNCDLNDIYFNNIKIRDAIEEDVRNKYSIVFQDFRLYAFTVSENVLMRKVDNIEDEKKVINALKTVGLWEKIAEHKDGINAIVTREFDENGIVFSGGEAQKLAIARVFASEANIYVLDEPTSSLDPIAEKEINDLIINNSKDKTIIIIAHRLSTVVDTDRIILLENGQIIEDGTHEQLIKLHGKYHEMFTTQATLYQRNNTNND